MDTTDAGLEEFAYSSRITLSSRSEPGVIVSASRWKRIKNRVRKCKRDMDIWAGFAFTFLGIAIPCAIQEFANYQALKYAKPPQQWTISTWGFAAIIAFGLSICCFIGYRQSRSAESESLESVLEEMDEIEASFQIVVKQAETRIN